MESTARGKAVQEVPCPHLEETILVIREADGDGQHREVARLTALRRGDGQSRLVVWTDSFDVVEVQAPGCPPYGETGVVQAVVLP